MIPIRDTLARTGDSKTHRIQARPGRFQAALRGPRGQDFDLYVRAGLQPSRREFDARGFSATPNEQVVVDVAGGEIFVMIDSWRGSGEYELEIRIDS